jgi:tRNA A-37 threonylcarbamoyl transferase component Bud32
MPHLIDGLKNLLRPSPALRSWIAGNALLDRGLPTARPLVMLHRRRFGLPTVGYLLCEKVADAVELPDTIPTRDPRTLRRRIDRLGQLLACMHDRQLAHRDLKAANLLMDSQEQFWFIDLVGMECDIAPSTERRLRDLTRLAVSFASDPRIRNTDRLRFLRAYFAWGLHGSAGWKSTWRTLADAVARKIDRNRKRGRVIA